MRSLLLSAALLAVACESKPAAPAPPPVKIVANVEAAEGEKLFAKYCALCHGANGEGYAADNAPSLVSKTFLESASDEFLHIAIEQGRPGTAMAGYGATLGGPLKPKQIEQIIQWIRRDAPPPVHLPPVADSGDPGEGARIYATQCLECHGTRSRRADAVHLANPAFLASASPAYLRHAVLEGRPGTKMEPYKDKLSPKQVEDVVTFIRTLASPVPPLPQPELHAKQPAPPHHGHAPDPTPEITGDVVINPKGKHASFTLKNDRLISPAQLAQALKEKRRLVIIDARAPSDFHRLHIPGAIPVPYYDPKGLDRVPNDGTWVVAYCACPHHASGVIVDELRRRGYPKTAVMDEGIFAWQHAGHPVVAAEGQLPVPAPPATTAAPK